MEIAKLSKNAVNKAAKVIESGGVVVFPTDTVYGFLADACNEKAVEKIYKIKKRPRSKPLAVFVKDFKMAKELAEINEEQEEILVKRWPGKYTFILKIKSEIRNSKSETDSKFKYQISKLTIGRGNTIGIRIPKYKFLNNLLKKINRPLAQTSVNISGQPPPTKISEIKEKFATSDVAMLIIDAENLPKSKPSTIIDLSNSKIKTLRK